MKILIVYYQVRKFDRNTIDEHLYAFGRYSGEECHYLNVFFGIPRYITLIPFDLVIYHYTFTSLKWDGSPRFSAYLDRYSNLKKLSGYKVAIPQDEYVNSIPTCEYFSGFGIKTVFTCLSPSDYQKVYPQELSGLDHYITVLTGYIDERSLDEVSRFRKPHHDRGIDIGYRARKLPFWLGRHGMIKWQLTEKFQEACRGMGLKADLSNDYRDVFVGKDWYFFLSNCRVVLGCEGGASLHDPDGSIRACVESYAAEKPDASFEDVEKKCFKGLDGNLRLFAISPRHFEACITKTCQALVEGDYAGIFKPGIHYIEIKKDWSNIEEVIRTIRDIDLCEKMAEQAYRDIVLIGDYTYRKFVLSVLDHVRKVHHCSDVSTGINTALFLILLDTREKWPFLFSPLYFIMPVIYESRLYIYSRDTLFAFLKRHNLEREYQELRHGNLGLSGKFFKEFIRFLRKVLISVVKSRMNRTEPD
jgi:hypothetical protein